MSFELFLCIVVNMTCRISPSEDGGSFHLDPLVFCVVFCRSFCLSSLWSLYVLWFTVSDYLFGIFNCVLLQTPSVCLNILRTLCVQYVHVYVCIQWSRTDKQCWLSVNRLCAFCVNIVNGVIFFLQHMNNITSTCTCKNLTFLVFMVYRI